MKKLATAIVVLVLLVGMSVLWGQQDRMFIHTGLQVHEFATENVDSIVPILGTTPDLDELRIYKNDNVYTSFLVDDIGRIIFYDAGPFIVEINLSELTWEKSYVYNIMVDNEVVGQLAYEFLHKHMPGETNPVVRERTVVAYLMGENGRADLSSGFVVKNGYFVTWNPRASVHTPPHQILYSYVAGETVTTPPTKIFLQKGAERVTTINDPSITNRISATLKPFVFRDERIGTAVNGETIEVEYYGVVKIGTQFWMRENLRTRRLADGTPIPTGSAVEPWLNAARPGAFIGSRGISGITNSSNQNNVLDANCNLPASVALRNRYGVVYNFHAVTNATGTLTTPLEVVDRLSPEGWSIPVLSQFALLVNYVYNVFGSGDNLPSGTGTNPPIAGTNLREGRLSGYTREAFPGDGVRATNITGFGAIGNNGRSSSATGWNSNTRFMVMDTYEFFFTGERQTAHMMTTFQINTNTSGATFEHSPSWRRHNTHWAEGVRLIMGYYEETESPMGMFDFGTGYIVYNFHPPLANFPVRLHYHIPRGDPTTMPILFSMHGNGRNAVGQINAWRAIAEEHQVMVFAPEFSTQFFPGNIQYHRGWVSSSGTSWNPRPQEQWSFTLIEQMFDFILEQTGSKETHYDIVGHSAGSQFIHRMMFFLPDARIRTGIAANAGFYMMPTLTGEYGGGVFGFPYSLGGTGTTFNQADLEAYFARNLIVHLGVADSIQDGDVNVTPGANAQGDGPSRLSRGHFFYNFAKQKAEAMGVPFSWRLVEVPGVAHSAQGMIQAPNVGSAALLFVNPSQATAPSRVEYSPPNGDRKEKLNNN